VLLRIAVFCVAVLLVLGSLPAMRRADRAVAEGRRSAVLYESARAVLAIAAAAAICLWLLSGL